MISFLKDKLAGGDACHICWNTIANPQFAGVLAQQPFDGVTLDAQHGFYDEKSLADTIPQVLLAGKAPLVRIPLNRWDLCERVLDFGAVAVIAPMINTKANAEQFAQAAKYPKIGNRSYGPATAAALHGITNAEYVLKANESTLALAQIETQEAYDNLDDILNVEGIDGVLMGPSDFSISVTGEPLPDAYGDGTHDMVADIAQRTNQAGKIAAAFTVNAEQANLVKSMGYKLVSIMFDAHMIANASNAAFDGLD